MKAPPDRAVLRLSRPNPQFGQSRGLPPSARGGKRCGSSTSSIFSRTSEMRRSAVSANAAEKSRQNRASTSFQSRSPAEMSSSSPSRSAVKS